MFIIGVLSPLGTIRGFLLTSSHQDNLLGIPLMIRRAAFLSAVALVWGQAGLSAQDVELSGKSMEPDLPPATTTSWRGIPVLSSFGEPFSGGGWD